MKTIAATLRAAAERIETLADELDEAVSENYDLRADLRQEREARIRAVARAAEGEAVPADPKAWSWT